MPTTAPDPYEIISNALEAIITDEFEEERFPVVHDRLHESVGHSGTRIGISIEDQTPQLGNQLVLDTDVLIQFYGKWDKEIDPNQKVDPRKVSMYAHRLRTALSSRGVQASDAIWFFNIMSTSYPSDPTGNKTRFELLVRAKGDNSGLRETS